MDNFDLKKFLYNNPLLNEIKVNNPLDSKKVKEAFDHYIFSWKEGTSIPDPDTLRNGPTQGSKIDFVTWEKDGYYFTEDDEDKNRYNIMAEYLKTKGLYRTEEDIDGVGENAKIAFKIEQQGDISMTIIYPLEYLNALEDSF